MRKLHESIWSDIQARSTGETTRKEDDVNLLDKDGLYEYLISHYKPVEGIDIKSYIFCGNSYINLCVFIYPRETRYSILLDILNCRVKVRTPYIKRWPANLLDMIYKKYNREDIIDNNRDHMTLITPKEGKGNNQFYIDFLDMILNNVDKPLLKKVINESVWSDIQDRSSGEVMRKEDDIPENIKEVLGVYINLFANRCYYQEDYTAQSRPDFKAFIRDFANNIKIEPYNPDIKELKDFVDDHWDDILIDLILKAMNEVDKAEEELTDKLWDELHKEDSVSESIWSDIQDRSTGEKERKEDEMTQDDLDAVDDFIFGFATRVVWDGVKDSLTNFLKYIDENPEALDCDIDRVKKYVEDNWHKGICDDVEAAIEQEYKEKEQDLNESVWSDIQDRSSGETVRKEDEMNDNDFLMLRETAKMFQVGVRNYANPKNRKYVPRRIDGQEGFIDYILERKNEHFWSDTPDETYDKVIKFVKDNWGDCTGIQDFMDKYLSNINECEGVPGGATPGCIGGMGPAYFPGADGTPGSGDLPSPTGIVYQQVAPFSIFIKDWKKKKKKKKKFRKEDEPCVHSPNKKVYNYVDDYREYVDRTYNNIDRRR